MFHSAGITSTLLSQPQNTAVRQGAEVTLHCSSDTSVSVILWYNSLCVLTTQQLDDCANDLIYSGYQLAGNVPSSFNVTEYNNATHITRDLYINPTQLTDAGVYLCGGESNSVIAESSSAQLVILGNHCSVIRYKNKKV